MHKLVIIKQTQTFCATVCVCVCVHAEVFAKEESVLRWFDPGLHAALL